MTRREHITFKNERVISFLDEAKQSRSMSKFVEEAVAFYIDNMGKEVKYTTKEDVQGIILEYFGQVIFKGPIKNNNYIQEKENIRDEISEILSLGGE